MSKNKNLFDPKKIEQKHFKKKLKFEISICDSPIKDGEIL